MLKKFAMILAISVIATLGAGCQTEGKDAETARGAAGSATKTHSLTISVKPELLPDVKGTIPVQFAVDFSAFLKETEDVDTGTIKVVELDPQTSQPIILLTF